jgi:hypothetical protein
VRRRTPFEEHISTVFLTHLEDINSISTRENMYILLSLIAGEIKVKDRA